MAEELKGNKDMSSYNIKDVVNMKSYSVVKLPKNTIGLRNNYSHLVFFYYDGACVGTHPCESYEIADWRGMRYIEAIVETA